MTKKHIKRTWLQITHHFYFRRTSQQILPDKGLILIELFRFSQSSVTLAAMHCWHRWTRGTPPRCKPLKNPGKEQCNHPWICWKNLEVGGFETGSVTAVDLELQNLWLQKKWTSLCVIQVFRANHPHLVATLCSSFTRENGHPLVIRSSLSTAQFQFLTFNVFVFGGFLATSFCPETFPRPNSSLYPSIPGNAVCHVETFEV